MLKPKVIQFLNHNIIKTVSLRLSSTAAELKPDSKIDSFRTLENDPTKQTLENAGHFYRLPTKEKSILFQYGGLPKTFEIQCKTFNETCIMLRPPSLSIIDYLKALDYNKPALRFVLYGTKGSGKTLSLAHIIHYAHRNNFLIVHVPWVGNWMRRFKERSNSEVKEGFIDLNLDAAAWLLHFKTQNAELLKTPEFQIAEDIHWSKREITAKGSSLLELIDHGLNRVKYASQCVNILAEHVKQYSRNGLCKTLVAIDGFNAFFYPKTRIYTEKKVLIPPSKVTITEAFLNLTKFDWNHAAIVVTVDELAIADEDQISYFPKYLLGKAGFEHLDPFIPVAVPNYSMKEVTSVMDYYRERKWIQPHPGQDDELNALSLGNPYKLMMYCNPL